MKKFALLFVVVVFALVSCNDDDPIQEQLEEDIQLIETYLEANNLVAESTESGLHYIVEEEGNGNFPLLNYIVDVNYKGLFLDGTVFEEGSVSDFPLYIYINGWQEGIRKFSEGGKGTLFIPSKLGYGTSGSGKVPGNTVIIFEIELIKVEED